MVEIEQLLSRSRIVCDENLPTKKHILERVSELLVLDLADISEQELFEAFVAREKLGSTSLGHGVALPHVRHDGITEPRAAFIKLTQPIEFDSVQGVNADLIFALLVPGEAHSEHLQILAKCAALFKQPDVRHALRQTHDPEETLKTLVKRYEH